MRGLVRVAAVLAAATVVLAPTPAQAAPGPVNAPEYWFDSWRIPDLWASGVRGQGVTIAEIDTGVNASLPELAGRVLPGKDFGRPGNGQVDREVNNFGHGTAMASIMVGREGVFGITGLAPDSKLLPIAVPLTGTTDAGSDDHLADAIRWAVDHGANIVSMSVGGARSPARNDEPCPSDEQQAIYYALRKGAVLLASGGNRGKLDNAVEEPGVCLGVVSVGAVDAAGHVADFSSRHAYLTLTAPGVNIASLSRVAGAAYAGNGTSQATAIASAVAALVWSKYPKLSGRALVARLLATLDRHRAARDPAYGYGTLNGYRAVTAAVPATAPDPVAAAADPFVARATALTDARPRHPPRPAGGAARSTGTFVVGSSPRLFTRQVTSGSAVALAGLLALVALMLLARTRRRQFAAAAAAIAAEQFGPSRTEVDDTGLVWHEILNPEQPSHPD